jgi:glycosyltransferase involved in cell wall biosynthesis
MFGFVPHSDVQVLFKASNVAVQASPERFNSGAALLALSFGRPILAPRNCVPPSVETGLAAIIYDPDAPGELECAMREAPSKFKEDRSDDIRATIADRSPDVVAQKFVSILRTICGRPDGSAAR